MDENSLSTLCENVLSKARQHGFKIATAESCTGGLIVGALTDIPGSSDVVDRGFITYSNAAKIDMLNVNPATIEHYGAVSEETVAEMAKGALAQSSADITISVSGIAGPDGGSKTKPVGTVCFGLAQISHDADISVITQTKLIEGTDRKGVRHNSVLYALNLLSSQL